MTASAKLTAADRKIGELIERIRATTPPGAAITAQTTTVYRASNGRSYLRKGDAYLATARHMVKQRCSFNHGFRADMPYGSTTAPHRITCKLCDMACIHGHKVKADYGIEFMEPWEPCFEPSHSYRHKLVVRLARWLRWRDERIARP